MEKRFILSAILAVFIVSFNSDCTKPDPPPKKKTAPAPQEQIKPNPNAPPYLGCAGGYLQSLNTYDKQLAVTMAGANTGVSTLDDIRQKIKDVKYIEDAAWSGDYKKCKVPGSPEYQAVHAKITQCRKLHDSAFKEMLLYWKDQNAAHVQSGMDVFKHSAEIANECIDDLLKIMKAIPPPTPKNSAPAQPVK